MAGNAPRLKRNKKILMTEKCTEIALAQLDDSVGAANEDEEGREEEEAQEDLEVAGEAELGLGAGGLEDVVGEERAEGDERDDLEDEAGE